MKKNILVGFLSFLIFSGCAQSVAAADYACQCNDGTKFILSDCSSCAGQCSSGVESCQSSTPTTPTASGPKTLPNPLGITDINSFIARTINFVLSLVGSVSLLLFVYGGVLWMTSMGNPGQVKKGKEVFIWAVIGLAVVFTSYILVKFVIVGITT